MKGLFLIPFLLLGALPQAKAQVDPEVHKMCASVADYVGCVKANSSQNLKEANTGQGIPESAKNCIEKTYGDILKVRASAERYQEALLKICMASNSLSKRVISSSKTEIEKGLKDFRLAAYDHYRWHRKEGKSIETETSIKFSACMQGFAKSENYLMPSSFMSKWRYLPDEDWDKWFKACLWYTNPYVYTSGGLNFVYNPDDKSNQVAFDFVGAKNVILKGRKGRYIRFTASDTIYYRGYTIPGERGYVDCAWGGSSGGSWDYYSGSNSGYCRAEEGTEDTVVPPSVRNQMWVFTIDCIDKTFDRNKDQLDWESVEDSWTARKGFDVLCPLIDELPVEPKS